MIKKSDSEKKATLDQMEECEALLQNANQDQLKNFVMSTIINMDFTKSIYHQFIDSVGRNKKAQALSLKAYCHIRPGLRFRYIDLLALSESYMMNYIPEIIEAAERNDGPHATREIMLIAAAMRDEDKCPFVTSKGLLKRDKILVNYILRMAGYELKSRFFSDIRQSRKAWVKSHGFKGWTKVERILEVEFQVKNGLETTENKVTSKIKEESALNSII